MNGRDVLAKAIKQYEEKYGDDYSELLSYDMPEADMIELAEAMQQSVISGIPGLMVSLLPDAPMVVA